MLNMIPLFIGALALVIIALIGCFKRLIKKYISCLLIILAFIISVYAITEISVFSYDIEQKNYVVHFCEFNYMQVSGNRKDVFEISNTPELSVRCVSDLKIRSGVHSGYILCTGNSRWVIAYSSIPFQ